MQFIVREDQHKQRLDVVVTAALPRLSRAYVQKLCNKNKVTVHSAAAKPGTKVQEGDLIQVDYNAAELDNVPGIDLPILYEDEDVVAISKPAGILTHAPGTLSLEPSVASFLRNRAVGLEGERAGVVHRLDRATSGVLVGAKNAATLSFLQKQFAERKVKKVYTAIVEGHLRQQEAIIDMPIERNPKAPATFRVGTNGKPAQTHYKVLKEHRHATLIELKPATGRTHQLRVHLANLGHAIVGDPLYGKGRYGDRLYLHALSLELTLPNQQHKTFIAPLPSEFEQFMEAT